MDEDDLALDTLLNVARSVAPNLDTSLIRQCYEIQKKHQFSNDRLASVTAMERLIDGVVDERAGD